MAGKKYNEWEKNVNTTAKVCPVCGRKYPSRGLTMSAKIFFAIFLLIILGFLFENSENAQKSNSTATSNSQESNITTALPQHDIETPREKALRAVKLNYKWSKGGFDNIMMADFTIINPSEYTIKDITITCQHYAKSGTMIDSNTRTIYDIVPAKGKKVFKNFNMGFIHSQVYSSACECVDLKVDQ